MHQQRAAEAAYEVADAQYRSTVLTAFQNVADALRALQFDAATLKAQQRAVRAASDTLRSHERPISARRRSPISSLLNAQRTYQQALLALVQAQAARYRRHRRAVPGAGRRLVEPHRRAARSVQPGAANRTGRERPAAAGTNGA